MPVSTMDTQGLSAVLARLNAPEEQCGRAAGDYD
jgi:hypothetical protein